MKCLRAGPGLRVAKAARAPPCTHPISADASQVWAVYSNRKTVYCRFKTVYRKGQTLYVCQNLVRVR